MTKKEWPRTSFQTLVVKKIAGGVSHTYIVIKPFIMTAIFI